jgi:hypothetical protein
MTALTRNPTNPNFLQPNKFQLNFSRLPNVQYFCQTVSVPGISLSEAVITNPFVDIYSPGEKAIYDLINITFLVDEELRSWIEIHDWIRAMTFPEKFEEYKRLPTMQNKLTQQKGTFPQFSDASITILSSSNTPMYRFKFHDCFPTTLSTFIMNTGDGPDTQITADATFRYSYYDIEKLF